jgi:hypothetical protein
VKRRYVFSHNTSSTNSNTSTNSDSGEDGDIASQPTILANCDGLAQFRAFDAIAEEGIKRVRGGIKRTVWTYKSAGADGDQAGIKEGAVEVDVDAFTKSRGKGVNEYADDSRLCWDYLRFVP